VVFTIFTAQSLPLQLHNVANSCYTESDCSREQPRSHSLAHTLPKPEEQAEIKGEIKVTGRRGRKSRKLLDDLKEMRGNSHLKEKALDRIKWRARFGRGLGLVVRQTTK
jgi:hypothetical protein